MEKKSKKTGPKPMAPRKDVKPFFIRDVPVSLRNQAKAKAASQGVSLREFAIEALTEKVNATP